MRLLVSNEEAEQLIGTIPHRTCVDASRNHWIVSDQGDARAQSVLWLFCWAKTGMGNRKAERAARDVFDRLFAMKFSAFDDRIDHQYARDHRYSEFDLEAELATQCAAGEGVRLRTITDHTFSAPRSDPSSSRKRRLSRLFRTVRSVGLVFHTGVPR